MRNLIVFLWKHQFSVLFIVLEVVSLILLSNSYSYHKSLTSSTVNDFTGTIYQTVDNVTYYFGLKKENDKLAQENAVLRTRFDAVKTKNDTLYTTRDSLYVYRSAKVISTSINKQNNYLLLNKGSNDGIRSEMGVVSSNGIAGIVVGVSPHFSYAMSLLHHNMRISARIKKNNHLVNVLWDGKNYRRGLVVDIPSHLQLFEGDTIITSGNSLVFPEGILIGTIKQYMQSTNKDLSEAVIDFSTDFNKLRHVYVIENLKKMEIDTLVQEFDK
jgi:rod shape-determining protein MreC